MDPFKVNLERKLKVACKEQQQIPYGLFKTITYLPVVLRCIFISDKLVIKSIDWALAYVAQWLEHWPVE